MSAAPAARASMASGRARRVGTFALHAVEMIIAMIVGMAVLGVPVDLLAGVVGIEDLYHDAPFVGAIVMTVIMTVPMAAWMWFRGHGGPMIVEMSAAMVVPSVGLLLAAFTGLIEPGAIMGWQDPLMYVAMLGVMFARWEMYSGGGHR